MAAADLIPFIAQVNQIGVPILAAVLDKEKALVGAIAEALPGAKHQFCQLHYPAGRNSAQRTGRSDDGTNLHIRVREDLFNPSL